MVGSATATAVAGYLQFRRGEGRLEVAFERCRVFAKGTVGDLQQTLAVQGATRVLQTDLKQMQFLKFNAIYMGFK